MKTYHMLLIFLILIIGNLPVVQAQTDLLGKVSVEEILQHNRVYDIYVQRYQPDSASVAFLKEFDEHIDIMVLFGSWCHDSKRYIPEFLKVMQIADNANINVQYIAQDRNKQDPEGLSDNLNLQYTPTLIIYRDSQEIGRIIESPAESIEKDIVKIITTGFSTD